MELIANIYRSAKKEGMYLYVQKDKPFSELPEALTKQFGYPHLAMTLVLTPDRKLARANARNVIRGIQQNGFYLQMPPIPDLNDTSAPNEKAPDQPI